jgi:rubrerythrin
MLIQLSLDSAKHEHMLKAVLKMLAAKSNTDLVRETKYFRSVIQDHVKIEKEMLTGFEKLVDETSDRRIRFLLQEIISDEKRHHAVMKRISALLSSNEEVNDGQWWDFLFRYSRLTS